MGLFDKFNNSIPDYYDTMYLDGYKPWQITQAAAKTILKEHDRIMQERAQSATNNAEPAPREVIIKGDVRVNGKRI